MAATSEPPPGSVTAMAHSASPRQIAARYFPLRAEGGGGLAGERRQALRVPRGRRALLRSALHGGAARRDAERQRHALLVEPDEEPGVDTLVQGPRFVCTSATLIRA